MILVTLKSMIKKRYDIFVIKIAVFSEIFKFILCFYHLIMQRKKHDINLKICNNTAIWPQNNIFFLIIDSKVTKIYKKKFYQKKIACLHLRFMVDLQGAKLKVESTSTSRCICTNFEVLCEIYKMKIKASKTDIWN